MIDVILEESKNISLELVALIDKWIPRSATCIQALMYRRTRVIHCMNWYKLDGRSICSGFLLQSHYNIRQIIFYRNIASRNTNNQSQIETKTGEITRASARKLNGALVKQIQETYLSELARSYTIQTKETQEDFREHIPEKYWFK